MNPSASASNPKSSQSFLCQKGIGTCSPRSHLLTIFLSIVPCSSNSTSLHRSYNSPATSLCVQYRFFRSLRRRSFGITFFLVSEAMPTSSIRARGSTLRAKPLHTMKIHNASEAFNFCLTHFDHDHYHPMALHLENPLVVFYVVLSVQVCEAVQERP